jgi:hypothetical protein
MTLVITVDGNKPYLIEGPLEPAPVDWTISVELTWLNKTCGIAVAKAWTGGYSLEGLIGPDGWHTLHDRLIDSYTIGAEGFIPNKDHPHTHEAIIAAIRAEWSRQRHAAELCIEPLKY